MFSTSGPRLTTIIDRWRSNFGATVIREGYQQLARHRLGGFGLSYGPQ